MDREPERPGEQRDDEQDAYNLVAQGIRQEADTVFDPGNEERRGWDLRDWIRWGSTTFFEPLSNFAGWRSHLRDAFTEPFGEGSSEDWGAYLRDVATYLEEGTIQDEEDLDLFEGFLPRPPRTPTPPPIPREPESGANQDPGSPESTEGSESDNEDPEDEFIRRGSALQRPPQRTPEEVRELTRELRNQYLTAGIMYLQGWLLGDERQQIQQRHRMNRIEDQWTFFTAQLTPALQRHIAARGDEHLELEYEELNNEAARREQEIADAVRRSPATGGVRHLIF